MLLNFSPFSDGTDLLARCFCEDLRQLWLHDAPQLELLENMEHKSLNRQTIGSVSYTREASVGRQTAVIKEQASVRAWSILAFALHVVNLHFIDII